MTMANWKETTLGEVCDLVKGTIQTGPFGSQLHQSDYSTSGIPVVMPKDIIEGRISTASVARISDEHVERLSRHKLLRGDIVYGRRGDIGRQALVTPEQEGWICGTGCLLVRLGDSILNPQFLHYYLKQEDVIGWITQQAVGATMPNLNTGILKSVPVRFPQIEEQRRIAAVLGAYDALIENSQRRIEILEQMARGLYREWFVQFRYPGHEGVGRVSSPLGRIPAGWEVKPVKEILTRRTSGNVYRDADVLPDGEVPVIDQSTRELLGFHNNEPDHPASPLFPIAIFGDHTCKMQLLIEPFSIGPNVVPFVSAQKLPTSYVFYAINSLVHTQEYKRHWTLLNVKEIVVADYAIAQQFALLIQPMLTAQETLRKTIRNLRQTRDLLLPRLLGGHLPLPPHHPS